MIKKIPNLLVACTVVATLSTPAFAKDISEETLDHLNPMTNASSDFQKINLPLKAINKIHMAPAQELFKELGFSTTWDKTNEGYLVSNGERETILYVGKDRYFAYSTKSIGMTSPISFGAPPTMIKDTLYVPIELFNFVLGEPDRVAVKDNAIVLQTEVLIPNPFIPFKTVEEAKASSNFKFKTPTIIPKKYKSYKQSIEMIHNQEAELFQIIYSHNENPTLIYRASKGTGDNSGNHNRYATNKTISFGGLEITLKGEGSRIFVAIWEENNVSYSLTAKDGISLPYVKQIIKNRH